MIAFGKFLKELRDGRGLSIRQVVRLLAHRGSPVAISVSSLSRVEMGQVASPRPELLRGLAEVYHVSYSRLVQELIADRYGVGLDQAGVEQEGGSGGASLSEVERLGRMLNLEGQAALVAAARGLASDQRYRRRGVGTPRD